MIFKSNDPIKHYRFGNDIYHFSVDGWTLCGHIRKGFEDVEYVEWIQ